MSSQSFDPHEYKARQLREWQTAAAGWRKWWSFIEQGSQHVSDRLVELADIQPGHRVLDVATGVGEPAVTAARRVGPTGQVVATDQSPLMLEVGLERANASGLQNLEFLEMDAEGLDFPDGGFDAVLCRWGLMFLPELAGTLNRIRQSLAPGGKFATAVWSVPPKVPFAGVAMGALQRVLELPPPPPGAPSLFSLGPPGLLDRAFVQAGFADVRVESVPVIFELPTVDAYIELLRDTGPAIVGIVEKQPVAQQAAVWQAMSEGAQEFAATDGSVRMTNEAICAVGRR